MILEENTTLDRKMVVGRGGVLFVLLDEKKIS